MTTIPENEKDAQADNLGRPVDNNTEDQQNTKTNAGGQPPRTLSQLFAGYEKAHGRFEVKRTNDKGKAEGRAVTVPAPATEAIWKEHVDGTGPGLGIIPLLHDDTISWACIDLDVTTINHVELEKKFKNSSCHSLLPVPNPVAHTALCSSEKDTNLPSQYDRSWKNTPLCSATLAVKCSPNK